MITKLSRKEKLRFLCTQKMKSSITKLRWWSLSFYFIYFRLFGVGFPILLVLKNPVEICSFPSLIGYSLCIFHDKQMLKVEELDDFRTFSICLRWRLLVLVLKMVSSMILSSSHCSFSFATFICNFSVYFLKLFVNWWIQYLFSVDWSFFFVLCNY